MWSARTIRRVAGVAAVVALGVAAVLVLPGAGFAAGAGESPAATADPDDVDAGPAHLGRHPRLTEEQRDCLAEQGIERPERPMSRADRQERRAELRAAAEECGVELPLRHHRGPGCERDGHRRPSTDREPAAA
jgi:hypothetical protein